MKRQGGFTLVELVVVIVILGILAVTAAPKFLNLQEDARKASIQGLKGAMDSAAGIVYGKAALSGLDAAPNGVVGDIAVVYGYPAATTLGIGNAVEGLSNDWAMIEQVAASGTGASAIPASITYSFKGAAEALQKSCNAKYFGATASDGPRTEIVCGIATP